MNGPVAPLRPVAAAVSISSQVLNALMEAIESGELKAGQIYSMGALADRMGVSRTPVREAMQELQLQGLVRIVPNQGALILANHPEWLRDVREIRAWLEVPAMLGVAARATDEDISRLSGAVDRGIEAANQNDAVAFEDEDRAFHRALLELSGNSRLAGLVDGLLDAVATTVTAQADMPTHAEQHREIIEAIARHDGPAASEAMRRHFTADDAILASDQPDHLPG
jgi:DNA-binding GntR family transcriptional regulator